MICFKETFRLVSRTIKLTNSWASSVLIISSRNMVTFSSTDCTIDKYNGVNVDLDKVVNNLPQIVTEPQLFLNLLNGSLKEWRDKKFRAIWVTIKLTNSRLVPLLVENGFDYHHARAGSVTMVKWIKEDEPNNIPSYPYTNIGVGGLVLNDRDEVLVVKEKYNLGYPHWKFPGGYANQGEDFGQTAEREVLEETGIQAKFESVIAFRHSHRFQFKCSDIYFVCHLKPTSSNEKDLKPVKNLHEIADVSWIHYKELLPILSTFNAFILSHFLAIRKQKGQLRCQKMDTLVGKVDVYFVDYGKNLPGTTISNS